MSSTKTENVTAPDASGKVSPVPRISEPRPPAERYEDRAVRQAWGKISPITINAAAPKLWLTARAIKHRRHDSAPGQFPTPIEIGGSYTQAGQYYDLRLLELWVKSGFDLRNAPKGELSKLQTTVERAVEVAQPVMLSAAAEALIGEVLGLSGSRLSAAQAAVKRFRTEWDRSGTKPLEPEELKSSLRRLRNWRETWDSTGFPAPLSTDAVYRASESIFSLVELRGWLAGRAIDN